MKPQIRTLLTNLKAAVRLGNVEAVETALDDLRAMPVVAGNQAIPESLVEQVILPVGEMLAAPQMDVEHLRSMAEESHTAMRAVAAVAIARRYLMDKHGLAEHLARLARDPRGEVRATLAHALQAAGATQPDMLYELAKSWLVAKSPRQIQTALQMLPALPTDFIPAVLLELKSFSSTKDPEVRAALAGALIALAEKGSAERVLTLLRGWAEQEATAASWIIVRALSAAWAGPYGPLAVEVLRLLILKIGPDQSFAAALRALERHGAEIAVAAARAAWANDPNAHLKAIAAMRAERHSD